jgi:hypothetical protein
MKINELMGRVTKNDPTTGIEITNPDNTKITLPPEKAAELVPDPKTAGMYIMNKDALAMQQQKVMGPTIGSQVTIPDNPIEEEPVEEKMSMPFAGAAVGHKEGPAGQWRNKGPSKNRPARIGDLVGGDESFNSDDELLEKMLTIARLR